MRLFLTSNGFPASSPNSREELLSLVKKPVGDIRVMFIPTASSLEKNRSFVLIDRQEIEEMGVLSGNIHDRELDQPITFEELSQYDVIFVDGGNTFHLLQKVRESGFDTAIKEYLEKDLGVYVGVSAGTVLAGPNIEISTPWDDATAAALENTRGLSLTGKAYCPHFQEKDSGALEPYRHQGYTVKELRDGEAMMFDGAEGKLIVN